MTTFCRSVVALLPLLLTSCLSSYNGQENDLLTVSSAVQATPRYKQAKEFDSFLNKTLSMPDRQALLAQCTKLPSASVFCFTVLRERKLLRFLESEKKASETHFRQKPEPVLVELKKKRVKNWNQTQRANVRGLLAGMRAFSLDELKTIGHFALNRPECPNNIAVSTAALMEIHLPFENVAEQIARLYEKGARCTRRGTPNHEHYLTRSALFWYLEKKYPAAEKLLAKVVPADAYSGRALYWLYRTRLRLGKKEPARKTLARLQTQLPLSFHALMTQAVDKIQPVPGDLSAVPTRSQRKDADLVIEQAEILREMGFTDSAAKVVDWALLAHPPVEPAVKAYLSSLGTAPTQIRTLQGLLLTRPALRTQAYWSLAYPKNYFEIFSAFSSQVDPYLLLAIARKESTLDPKAVSRANAQGLLQLNPDTARKMAGSASIDLFDPRINAQLAARYMEELRGAMKGQLSLMIASYNAGEQTVASWTQRYPTTDPILFLDLIPYRETRDYVGHVLSNYYWYRRLYCENAQSTFAFLTTGELARVDDGRGIRSIKSVVDDALKTSETWPEDPPPPKPFFERWKELDSTESPF